MQLFTEDVLEKWKELDPKRWQKTVISIIDAFLESVPVEYQKLQSAFDAKNVKAVHLHSHSLKSSYGNVGAPLLQSVFAEIEQSSKVQDWDRIAVLLEQVDQNYTETIKFIRNYRGACAAG